MIFARALAALFAVMLTTAASAQTYPNRPITMIVPFPPGGATDAIARIIQTAMSQSLGQQLIIENIGGAGGSIAAARAARAAPDGYTIMIHQVALAASMSMYSKLTYDVEKDFIAVGLINTAASTVAARASLPPTNFAELVRWMKEPGQNTKVAHAGIGSFGHLAGVLLTQEVGATATQVPYRGAGPALNDLLAGVPDISSISAVQAGPLIKAGKLKGYAIIGRNRFAGLPELPTMAEVGYSKLTLDFWHMLLVPAGTPQPIIDKVNTALRAALVDPVVVKAFTDGGMELFPPDQWTPQAASALLSREIKMWGEVIRANGISAQEQN